MCLGYRNPNLKCRWIENGEDDLFSTAVDVRAKLHDGTEVIIEIQIRKQQYFLNRFHYYLANQLVENVQKLRK